MPICGDRAKFIINPDEDEGYAVCGAHVAQALTSYAERTEQVTVRLLEPTTAMSQRRKRASRLPCERRQEESSMSRRAAGGFRRWRDADYGDGDGDGDGDE